MEAENFVSTQTPMKAQGLQESIVVSREEGGKEGGRDKGGEGGCV